MSCKLETNNLWQDHRNSLTEHNSLGFNTTYTPTCYTQAVDHSGVRVSTNDGVRVQSVVAVHDDACEILKVDLMDNTAAWWNNLKIVEGLASPFEELEALTVPLELHLFVEFSGVKGSCGVYLDGMINNEVNRAKRVDFLWITAKTLHGVAHSGQVDDCWHTTIIEEKFVKL